MRCHLDAMIAVFTLFAATPAWADCSVSSDAAAAEKTIDPGVDSDADLVFSMSMMPAFLHIDYASVAKAKPSCKLGQFDAGTLGYSLYGDDDHGHQRIAKPDHKGKPFATMIPVVNLMKAIESSKNHQPPAKVEGYFLATIDKSGITGWIYYTGMPDADTLRHDMAQALAGTGHPIFKRNGDGKIEVFV